ncbi:MAG: isoprenylcysteine carboxylmethyltransferase family protein [Deltaproteobacteria bacterium]|nr:isoprenylcysteine carboxylmethyltransferase family protein [Deltaproteobacteria bacterium]
MEALHALTLGLFAATYLVVAVGVFRVFTMPQGVPRALWAVRAAVVTANVAVCAALAVSGPPGTGAAAAGLVLLTLSAALFAWCAVTTRRTRLSIAFSGDVPRHVQRDGPYAYVRHPFYTSYALSYVAGVVVTGEPWLLVPTALVLAVFHAAALHEERKFRASDLAEEYAAYARTTGMYLPRPGEHFWS